MILSWSVAMPLLAAPDEPSHIVKAAAVARGQWSGTPSTDPVGIQEPGIGWFVEIPADLAVTADDACFKFDDTVTADCPETTLDGEGSGTVRAKTYAGQYPPLYYVLVGWPTLVLDGAPAIYAMRVVSGLLAGALVLWGVSTLVRGTRRSNGLWAAAIALSPMCLFLFGSVNPNGLEIAAGFTLWAACLQLGRDTTVRTSLVVQAATAGAVLVLLRSSGPLWAVLIVAVSLLCARRDALRALARSRAMWWAGAVAVASGVAAVAWIATHGSLVTTADRFPELASPQLVVAVMLLAVPEFFGQMVGNFGWLDTEAPFPTVDAWTAAIAVVVLLALVVPGVRRRRAALLALLALVIVVPIVLTIPTAESAGVIWQGRYGLPLAVGVPLLAVPLLATAGPATETLRRRLAGLVVVLLAAGHAFAFYWAERRYAEGSEGRWSALDPQWASPLGFVPVVLLYTVLTAALTVLVVRDVLPPRTQTDSDTAVEPVVEPVEGTGAEKTVSLPA